jgi:phage terminase large subunit GpA-like protein
MNSPRVIAIKGRDSGVLPVSQPAPVDVTIGGRKIRSGLKIRTVNVSYFKSELYADLKKQLPTDDQRARGHRQPEGYCHFPKGPNYGDEHFRQMCAEELVTFSDRRTNRQHQEWRQLRARNEALDCRIYARAAAYDYGLDRFRDAQWEDLASRIGAQQSKFDLRPGIGPVMGFGTPAHATEPAAPACAAAPSSSSGVAAPLQTFAAPSAISPLYFSESFL